MATFSGSPAQSSDDGYEDASPGDVNLTAPNIRVLDGGTYEYMFVRIPGVTIPQGATISDASLDVEVVNQDAQFDLYCEDADDSATMVDTFTDISGRTRTTANVQLRNATFGTGSQTITGLASLVQEVVNRTGWASGNAIGFIFVRQTSCDFRIRGYDFGSLYPVLNVTYTAGTTYSQSVGGTLAPAGALSRQTNIDAVGVLFSGGGVSKQTAKTFAGTVAPAGVVATIKTILLTLAGSLGLTGNVNKQTDKEVAGSVGMTGILTTVRTFALSLAGAIVPSGALTRQTNTNIVGSLSLAGNVVKQTTKTLAGSVSPAGAVGTVRTFLLSLAGAIAPSGNLAKITSKGIVGNLSLAGNVVKQTTKTLAGSVSPVGAVDTIRTFLVSLSGVIAPSGAIGKQINKRLDGVLGLVGNAAKNTAKNISGNLGLAGNVIKQTAKSFGGAITPSGVLDAVKGASTFLVSVGGTLAPSGSLVKDISKGVSGNLGLAGNVIKRTTKTAFNGSLGLVGNVIKQSQKTFSGDLSLGGAVSTIKLFIVLVGGTLGLAGNVVKSTAKTVFSGTLGLSGIVTRVSDAIPAIQGAVALTLKARNSILTLKKRVSNLTLRRK